MTLHIVRGPVALRGKWFAVQFDGGEILALFRDHTGAVEWA